jgi:hypothetical protein
VPCVLDVKTCLVSDFCQRSCFWARRREEGANAIVIISARYDLDTVCFGLRLAEAVFVTVRNPEVTLGPTFAVLGGACAFLNCGHNA